MSSRTLPLAFLALPLFVAACSSAPEPAAASAEVVGACEEDATKECSCKGGGSGTKTCSASGKWGSCECNAEPAAAAPAEKPAAIAPVCTELKSCETGAAPGAYTPATGLDVKLEAASKEQLLEELRAEVAVGSTRARYLAAALAPQQAAEPEAVTVVRGLLEANVALRSTLSRNAAKLGFGALESYRARFPVPGAMAHVMDGAAPVACVPSLSIRLAKVTVTEEDDDIANDEVYCSISAQAKDVQELRITPMTRALNQGESQSFSGDETVVWGQGKPREASGDITLKYDCFEKDSAAGYDAFIKAAADAAKKYGTKVVSSDNAGYVSTGADLVATFLPQILALDSDDHLFKATQTIPAARQMELAKGATWTVRKSGTHLLSDWDWTLTMESWGCSPNGTK